jgi:hypothetical protein
MRAAIASAVAALVGALTPELSQRYVVVPTGRAVDADTYPCRAALSADGTVVAFDAYVAFDAADANRKSPAASRKSVHSVTTCRDRSAETASGTRAATRVPSRDTENTPGPEWFAIRDVDQRRGSPGAKAARLTWYGASMSS